MAAQVPLLTTHVGGIPEIFGPFGDRLGPPDDPADLARRIVAELRRPAGERAARAAELAAYVQGRFSLDNMAETVISAYREALAAPRPRRRASRRARRRARILSTRRDMSLFSADRLRSVEADRRPSSPAAARTPARAGLFPHSAARAPRRRSISR